MEKSKPDDYLPKNENGEYVLDDSELTPYRPKEPEEDTGKERQ